MQIDKIPVLSLAWLNYHKEFLQSPHNKRVTPIIYVTLLTTNSSKDEAVRECSQALNKRAKHVQILYKLGKQWGLNLLLSLILQ